MRPTINCDVLVLGGGSAGLSMSLLLSELGVDHLLVERHGSTALLPKAHVLNQRTMEIYRELGVADQIFATGSPAEKMETIAFVTTLAGDGPLDGRRIATAPAWSGGPEYFANSPVRAANLPQLRLEPILREHASERNPGRVLFETELVEFSVDADGVTAMIRDLRSNEEHDVRARFLIAADGGRTVGPRLGIVMEGTDAFLEMVSAHFAADLSPWWNDESVMIQWATNPEGEGMLRSGTLLPMGPDQWGAKSPEWQYHSALHTADLDRGAGGEFDEDRIADRVRAMLRLPDLELDILSVSRWRFEGKVANAYRKGRVFVVGDAAHRHPPNGGLGLNNALVDVQNLAWKLAYVLRGDAGDHLLDSYEAERRPLGRAVVGRALENAGTQAAIDDALGLSGAADIDEGWRELALFFEESDAGRERRKRVEEAVRIASREYTGQDIEIGFRYHSDAIVGYDPEEPIVPPAFVKTTAPGATIPHAWLNRPGSTAEVSTFDLVGGGAFTLFVDAEAPAWRGAVETALRSLGLPAETVRVEVIGSDGWIDTDGSWAAHREVSATGAVLARPDRHVAWRADALDDGSADDLAGALAAVLAKVPG